MFLQALALVILCLGSAWAYTNQGARDQDYYQQNYRPSRLHGDSLKQVHIIFRHGDRAPVFTYPTDPNTNYEWPFGREHLTDVGKRQHFELGTFLRNRYSQLVSGDPREVLVRSSNVDRCLASVQSNLAAFFRPSGKWIWNKDLPWQPVPIQTAPPEKDYLLNALAPCPVGEQIALGVINSTQGLEFSRKHQGLYDYLTEHSGMQIQDSRTLTRIYDTMFINRVHNLTTPQWLEAVWDEFAKACDESLAMIFQNKPFARVKGGHLLGHIIDLMKKYDQEDHSTVHPKVYMYSTHDAVVAPLLAAMGVFNDIRVPYAATVLVELHEQPRSRSKYSVRVFYRNTTDHEPYQMFVPNCQQDCPLDDFDRLRQHMIPTDIEEECTGSKKEAQKQTLVGVSQQGCCCCNQCGNDLPPLTSVHNEKLLSGPTGPRMRELLLQMRELLEQHRRIVDKSVQDLIREMEDSDQEIQRIRSGLRESTQRVSHQAQAHNPNNRSG